MCWILGIHYPLSIPSPFRYVDSSHVLIMAIIRQEVYRQTILRASSSRNIPHSNLLPKTKRYLQSTNRQKHVIARKRMYPFKTTNNNREIASSIWWYLKEKEKEQQISSISNGVDPNKKADEIVERRQACSEWLGKVA